MIPVHFKQTANCILPQQGPTAVRIRDLSVSYGGKPALLGIAADVQAASMTAIIGPNGRASRPCSRQHSASCRACPARWTCSASLCEGSPACRLCAAAGVRRLGLSGTCRGRCDDGPVPRAWAPRPYPPASPGIRYALPRTGGHGRLCRPADRSAFRRPAAACVPCPCAGAEGGSLSAG